MREQLEMLKHHADPGPELGQIRFWAPDRDAVDDDLAFLKGLEAVHAFDQRRFAGSGWAAYDDDLALGDLG